MRRFFASVPVDAVGCAATIFINQFEHYTVNAAYDMLQAAFVDGEGGKEQWEEESEKVRISGAGMGDGACDMKRIK